MTAATRMPNGRWRVVTGIGKHRTYEFFDTVEEASKRLQEEVYLSRGQYDRAKAVKAKQDEETSGGDDDTSHPDFVREQSR